MQQWVLQQQWLNKPLLSSLGEKSLLLFKDKLQVCLLGGNKLKRIYFHNLHNMKLLYIYS